MSYVLSIRQNVLFQERKEEELTWKNNGIIDGNHTHKKKKKKNSILLQYHPNLQIRLLYKVRTFY